MGDERRTEHLLTSPHALQRQVPIGEHRHRRRSGQARSGAVDVQRPRRRVDLAAAQRHPTLIDPVDVPQSHDVVDPPQFGELPERHDRAVVHGGPHRGVEAQQVLVGFQPGEQVVEVGGFGDGGQPGVDGSADLLGELLTRLDVGPVHQPRVSRPHPAQLRRGDAVAHQPQAAVHPGFAAADDREVVVVTGAAGQIVGGDDVDAVTDLERGRAHGLHLGEQIGRIDHPAAHRHGVGLSAEGAKCVVAQVSGHREVGQPSGRQQPVTHHPVVVGAHLVAGGQLEEPLVGAGAVDGVLVVERLGVHAVVGRWLVQPHKRIDPVPVPAGLQIAVDEHDGGVRLGQQCVDERHSHGARPDDQVVSFDAGHGPSR